jgi:hypothetical protein
MHTHGSIVLTAFVVCRGVCSESGRREERMSTERMRIVGPADGHG